MCRKRYKFCFNQEGRRGHGLEKRPNSYKPLASGCLHAKVQLHTAHSEHKRKKKKTIKDERKERQTKKEGKDMNIKLRTKNWRETHKTWRHSGLGFWLLGLFTFTILSF